MPLLLRGGGLSDSQLLPLLSLFLGSLLLLDLLQSVHTISKSVGGVEVVRDLLATDQADDDAAAHHEGEDEAVHRVPRRGQASDGRAGVGVVEEVEGEELTDQRVLDREKEGWPCDGGCGNTDCVALHATVAAILGPLETPVDGTEEGEDLFCFFVSFVFVFFTLYVM